MSDASMPFLDLFLRLQKEMRLAPEQYDLLRQALNQGYGWGTPENLKRLCRLLWVKPRPYGNQDVFERIFQEYWAQQFLSSAEAIAPTEEPTVSHESEAVSDPPPTYPKIPPRRSTSVQSQQAGQAPVAVKTRPPQQRGNNRNFVLTPTHLPVSLPDVRRLASAWRRLTPDNHRLELDPKATIAQIEREGKNSELVLRPVLRRRSDLLVLVDDSNAMIPFQPVIQPFITVVEQSHMTFARIYRFTNYPGDYLYHWQQAFRAEALTTVQSRLHPNRTIVLILSDAGAATGTYNSERADGIEQFLLKLSPCVQQILWINPLPQVDWWQTTAATVEVALRQQGAAMVPLDRGILQQVNWHQRTGGAIAW